MALSQRTRILIAEAIGTAILVLGGPGTVIFGQYLGFNVGVLGVSLAFGLSLLCAAYLFGSISGCHINPAVTVALWAMKKTDTKDVPYYIVGQILGAAVGAGLITVILEAGDVTGGKFTRSGLFSGASNGYGSHSPSGFDLAGVGIAEVVFTAIFVLVIVSTTRQSFPAANGGIAVGLMLALVHLISIPIDNTSVNPARSLATAIYAEGWAFEQLWAFVVLPIVGGLLAAITWKALVPADDF